MNMVFFVGHVRLLFPCRSCLCASKFADERPSVRLVEQVVARIISIWPPKRPISLGLAGNCVFSFPLNGFPPVLLRVPPRSGCQLAPWNSEVSAVVSIFESLLHSWDSHEVWSTGFAPRILIHSWDSHAVWSTGFVPPLSDCESSLSL